MQKPSTTTRRRAGQDANQDIVRDDRGQDQPANRRRAQQATTTRQADRPDAERKPHEQVAGEVARGLKAGRVGKKPQQ